MHKRDQLRQIMRDNGSFVAFPVLGAGANTISAYAENRVNAERTLRMVNYLACEVYEAQFTLRANTDLQTVECITQLISTISRSSGAELVYRSDTQCIEATGLHHAIQTVYELFLQVPIFVRHHKSTVFAVELASDQREFLSGKKNGKINKIMKTCGARIKFLPFNEYNFVITVESDDCGKALEGLEMLQDELPAEMSFYVPEIYHRRIIGVGGKSIQRVMKRFGVYVKFSGAEEFSAMGGYFENEHNVVARTPNKNKENLEYLKQAVMEFVSFPKDRDFITTTVQIPYYQQRRILLEHADALEELCQPNNVRVWWPEKDGSNTVTVIGPASQLEPLQTFFDKVVTCHSHLTVPPSDTLRDLVETQAVDGLKKDLDKVHVELAIQDAVPQPKFRHVKLVSPKTCVFRLAYARVHAKQAEQANAMVRQFLLDKNVPMQPTPPQENQPHPFQVRSPPSSSSSPLVISPASSTGDSCLRIDQEVLASIKSPQSDDTSKAAPEFGRDLFDTPFRLAAFDGSWSIFPNASKRSNSMTTTTTTLSSNSSNSNESPLSLNDGPLRAIFENTPDHPLDGPRRASASVVYPLHPNSNNNIWSMQSSISTSTLNPNTRIQPRPYASFSATTTGRPNLFQPPIPANHRSSPLFPPQRQTWADPVFSQPPPAPSVIRPLDPQLPDISGRHDSSTTR